MDSNTKQIETVTESIRWIATKQREKVTEGSKTRQRETITDGIDWIVKQGKEKQILGVSSG